MWLKKILDHHRLSIIIAFVSVLISSFTLVPDVFASSPANGTIIYHDGYSSNAGWTQIGTQIVVDSPQFPNMIKFNNVAGGGGSTEERVYKQLPSTLPAYNWVLETNYMFTSSSIPIAYPVALTIDSSNPEVVAFGTSAPAISIFHGLGTDQLGIESLGSVSSVIPVSPNIQYYLKLERTSSQLVLFVFSDSARTQQIPGSPVFLNFDSTKLPNLNFIQHSSSKAAGSARTITAQITNTTIYQATLPNATISTIPSSPTGLTATAISSQINLSWTASSNNGNSQITGYKIYRSTSSGSETLLTTLGNFTSYSDTGVTTGITYFYKVTSVNSVGESLQSNEASAILPIVTPPPGQGQAQGTVTIVGTCGVQVNPTTINYGIVTPGNTPVNATNSVGINNTGSVNALLTVTGGNWTNGVQDIILASKTQFNNHTAAGPFTPLQLHNVPTTMSTSFHPSTPHTSSLTAYWQLIPQLLNLGFTGSLTQSLTFSASC